MNRNSNLFAFLGLILTAASLHALTPNEWKYRQQLDINSAGPLRFLLPVTTLDLAQPDLRDLRIVDSAGKETPYLLLRPSAESGKKVSPKNFKTELTDSTTILTLETGTHHLLDFVELETGANRFLKAVRVELSADGENWQTFADGVPVFRQDGATKTIIELGLRTAAFIRLTLGDERTRPIVVTGATLQTAAERPAPTETFTPRISRTEEFAGETVLTLDLGAKNLSIASLEFSAEDSLFTRTVTVAVREFRDGQISEHPLARGTIFRVALDAFTPTADLRVPVNAAAPSRELVVHIENGDSPPLHVRQITAQYNPIHVVIVPTTSGRLELLTGNLQIAAPHYDLAALSAELNRLPLTAVPISEPTTNAAYRQADQLAGLILEGAALDTKLWKQHRVVTIATPGVQQLELDLHAIANVQDNLSDIRLMQGGKQVPYVVEHTGLSRDLVLTPVCVSDPKRPSLGRWKIALPQAGLPLSRLVLNSPSKLFDRRLQIYETLTDRRGETYQRPLANANWTHTPNDKPLPLTLNLPDRLQTDALWIETDNGDNPAIVLERTQVSYPVIRLLCKTTDAQPIELCYGNENVAAPRYDVALIAVQLLDAEKIPVSLGAVQPIAKTTNLLQGAHGGVLFWVVLALVVSLLLVVVAKLLPKSSNAP